MLSSDNSLDAVKCKGINVDSVCGKQKEGGEEEEKKIPTMKAIQTTELVVKITVKMIAIMNTTSTNIEWCSINNCQYKE